MNKISDAELEIAKKMIEEGYNICYIAFKLNRSYGGLYRRLSKEYKRHYKIWTKEEKDKIIELKKQGVSDNNIAKLVGANRVYISHIYSLSKKNISL